MNKYYDDYVDKIVYGDLDYITEAELNYYNSDEYDADFDDYYDDLDDNDNYYIDDDFDFDYDDDVFYDDDIFY